MRERDHAPAHVHLTGGGVDVLIHIDTLASIGQWPAGVKSDVLAWVAAHRDGLLKEWKQWHP